MAEEPAKPVDNGEAEPQAAVPVSLRSGELNELAEDILSVSLGNAGTAIPYLDTQHFTAAAASDDHSAMQRIAYGVGYQIEQDPLEQQSVAPHPRVTSHDAQTQALFPRRLLKCRLDFVQQTRNREVNDPGRKDPGIEPGNIQERIEHLLHFPHRCIDPLDRLCPFAGIERSTQLCNEQSQRMQWLPQIVARHGQKAGFCRVGELELMSTLYDLPLKCCIRLLEPY